LINFTVSLFFNALLSVVTLPFFLFALLSFLVALFSLIILVLLVAGRSVSFPETQRCLIKSIPVFLVDIDKIGNEREQVLPI
jgi:hypothetical protein